MRLQEQLGIALTQSEQADDDEAREVWQKIAGHYANLIAIKLAKPDPAEFNNGDWYLSSTGSRTIVGDVEIFYGQQILHMAHGYIGTGRFTLKLGDGTSAVSNDPPMLKATLIAYLNKQLLSPEVKADIVAKFFP